MKYWMALLIAGLFEVVWVFFMKKSEGFTRLGPSVFTLVALVISMGLLAYAMRALPMGTAYAIWTGIGALGAAVVGILVFQEPASAPRIACLLLVVGGIIGLKLTSGGQ